MVSDSEHKVMMYPKRSAVRNNSICSDSAVRGGRKPELKLVPYRLLQTSRRDSFVGESKRSITEEISCYPPTHESRSMNGMSRKTKGNLNCNERTSADHAISPKISIETVLRRYFFPETEIRPLENTTAGQNADDESL